MINGLDLFSGIGGLTVALAPWVRPVAYCEIDPYCQAVLLSRMESWEISAAPIWDDVQTLSGDLLPKIDIIYGGFPCQDISLAGNGIGLAGKRSGLFFEILRLTSQIRPRFLFLENVPAIRSRGADVVCGGLASLGYDCRWSVLSARDVGAPHIRKRWWLLAYANGNGIRNGSQWSQEGQAKTDPLSEHHGEPESMADSDSGGCQVFRIAESQGIEGSRGSEPDGCGTDWKLYNPADGEWWEAEPSVGRVVDGLPYRVEQLKALGNGVVPQCAREAFRRLLYGY